MTLYCFIIYLKKQQKGSVNIQQLVVLNIKKELIRNKKCNKKFTMELSTFQKIILFLIQFIIADNCSHSTVVLYEQLSAKNIKKISIYKHNNNT